MLRLLAKCTLCVFLFDNILLAAPPGDPYGPAPRKLNNLCALLLEAVPSAKAESFSFVRPSAGWIFISLTIKGQGRLSLVLDQTPIETAEQVGTTREAMHYVAPGRHMLRLECSGAMACDQLTIRAVPELMHCGLGFNPQIKSYGLYDLAFLKRDILPNVTTLIVPSNIKLPETVIDDWHGQGKRFIAEVGVNSQATTAEEQAAFWTGFLTNAPFLDGIIIDEFIVNRPVAEWVPVMTADRLERMKKEREAYESYPQAFKEIRADHRFDGKSIYAYVGGSGKKLNQEIIGTNVIRAIIDCGYFVAPERYLHEMSTEKGARGALQEFVDGLDDWEAKEPGVKQHMVITFGLFSMPSGSINKQPNVDYHVWMDQQMNRLANEPSLGGVAGLNWWTSLLADEETVRFVGKLYRHYAIEGNTNLLTHDPLFPGHIQNADFEQGTNGWVLHPAEPGTIAAKSFPRYGRIEGRYMGLGRPADPEHIGDTFLWMKRSPKGPNSFSQTVRGLQPGRLYSSKMMVCDYNDLVEPKAKQVAEAKSYATISIEGADVDPKHSFSEVYASNPEPKIPVCITYYWEVFRARKATALLTVSDGETPPFGQEQAFNFLELQPYHE